MSNWHRWERIPETQVIYLDEEQWDDFVQFVLRMRPTVNSWWDRLTVFFWEMKVRHFMAGWYGFWEDVPSDDGTWAIYIRESKYTPRLLHHEMGHIIQLQHTMRPGVMAPVGFLRWF